MNPSLNTIADFYNEGSGHWYVLFKDGAELEYWAAGTLMTPGKQAGWWFHPADNYEPIWTPDTGSTSVLWENDAYPYKMVSAHNGVKGYPRNGRFITN